MSTARELAGAIVAHLPGWAVEAPAPDRLDETRVYIARASDGARVLAQVGGWQNEGRISFSGCWPRFRDGSPYYGGKSVSITCSASRTPEAIARDFSRRFLPSFDEEHALALVYVKTSDVRAGDADAIAERIADVVGGEVQGRNRANEPVHIFTRSMAVHRLVVRPAYGSDADGEPPRVDFEVHGVSPETAARMLAIAVADGAKEETSEARVRVATPVRVPDLLEETEDIEEPEARRRSI
jgi:hypothetical protein